MVFIPLYLSVISLVGANGVLYEYPRNRNYINNQYGLTKFDKFSEIYGANINAFLCHSLSFMTLTVLAPFGFKYFRIVNSFRKRSGILKL